MNTRTDDAKAKKPFYKDLFFQVIFAILLGVAVGMIDPKRAVAMRPLGDGFISLIKMMIAPIIFCTMVSGIAGMGDVKQAGRLGAKAILYFEIVTTLALVIGWVLATLVHPGSDLHIETMQVDTVTVRSEAAHKGMESMSEFFLHMIPSSLFSPFGSGEILQVLLVAVLFASALTALGERGKGIVKGIESLSAVLFKMVDIVTRAAPVGAFGAMAYTVGKFGLGSLKDLGELVLLFYAASLFFVFGVLAPILWFYCRLSVWRFLKYIRQELLIVLGTASSETVLPRLMEKLVAMGCSRQVVGLVVPAGYSFNLDGSSLYFTVGAFFILYATHTDITFWQELTLIGTLLITSKGAAGVTGSAFLVLMATLSSANLIPQQSLDIGLALILAIDRFMSTGRAIVNLIGNGMATILLAKWEKQLDYTRAKNTLSGNISS